MPICEICGMESADLYDCSQCEAKFCAECGDLVHRLCYDCAGWEGRRLDESWEEVEGWDDGWNDDEPH